MESVTNDSQNEYHRFVPARDWAQSNGLDVSDPYTYSQKIVTSDLFQPIWKTWKANLDAPFYGVTNNGVKRKDLYALQDEGAPTENMFTAARNIVDALSPEEKTLALRPVDSDDCRKWSNPELVIFQCGVRLERLSSAKVELIIELLRQSLSEAGFSKLRGAMKINKFLGEICGCQAILNEYSYWFTLFGEPSVTQPWGYMFFGHHMCINVSVLRDQMVIGPVFIGAEPFIIDDGPDKGVQICAREGELGLSLMRSLAPELQQKAQTYARMHDQAMPEDRWNPADQRHLAGAFQDNRVIAYEGVLMSDMTPEQQELLMSMVAEFLILLPPQPLEARLNHIRSWASETYFSWIGGYGLDDPFYYRIQSPVVILEFDHHSGVFLTNKEPAKYHIHTTQRLPNGNDYGRELKRLARSMGVLKE
ncbi:hypothetical protein B0J13DRAFT_570223 [Dactylonectria estremocensis]|uniref:DUF3500 domain-containing protein n=1 Tax=Dactylonectria estremocensis TaxID=1079267 RepID=A0A9P9DFM0_9HYPO|nr:hypothetical protein B0J13DRAFT_570223 [Dactylonectria estremocensis]